MYIVTKLYIMGRMMLVANLLPNEATGRNTRLFPFRMQSLKNNYYF